MKDTTELLTVELIRDCVYTIRGQQVMLDSDLAKSQNATSRKASFFEGQDYYTCF